MNKPSKHEYGRKALAVAVAAALVPTVAQGAAGRVDFAYGDVKSVKPSGLQQRLRKGSQIEQGDTIVTARGRAQIRFSDGARTSLLPNSEFRVDAYEYEEEAEEEATGFFSLLKGGLRTITGAIGKLRRDAYQLTTPSATIGIRGTEYLVVLGNSASIWVGDGEIEACNDGGCQSFVDGESGYVADRSTRPIRTTTKPDTSAADLGTEQSLIVGDVVDDDGLPLGITDGSIPETGYTVAISVGDGTGEGHLGSTIEQDSDLQVTLDAGNGLLQLLDYGTGNGELTGTRGTATVLDVGNSAGNEVVWGRWTTGIITTDTYAPPIPVPVTLTGSESHHYAAGIPTADMPGEGVTASYNLIGGTAPTYADGSGVGTLDAASLNVDFGTRLVDVDVIFTIGGNQFFINSPFTPLGSGEESHAFFAADYLTTGVGCGPGGCFTELEGFFAEPGASHAGLVYLVFDNSADSDVNGAAGFVSAGAGTPIPPPIPPPIAADGTVAISVGDGTGEGHLGSAIEQGSDLQVTLDSANGLLQLLTYGTGNGELTGTRGTATVLDVGNSAGDEVLWGRWTTGIITTDTYAPPIPVPVTLTGSESHHYAAGIPPADMPGEGVTASYNLIGGTAPTYADGSGVGTLDAASLNVDFGTHLVAVEVIFTIGGNEFFIDSPFTPLGSGGESHAFFAYGNLTTGPGCGVDGCSTDLEGFFAGPGASHAGLVYLVFDNSADSHVNGAVGFEQAGSGEPINPTDPSNPLRDGQLYVLSVAVEDETFSLGSTASIRDSLVDATFDDNKLTSFGVGSGGEFVTTTLVNGEQVLDAGRDDTAALFLGRWTNGTVEVTYPPEWGYPPESEALGPVSLHYAGGLPTVRMPMGTGSYQLISGTTPTYSDGSGTGTLDSGSLNVDFDTSLVSVDLAFTINDNQFFIDSPFTPIGTGPYAHTFSFSGRLTTGDACMRGCYTYIKGFFAGEGASRAGLTYRVGNYYQLPVPERYVNGAAGFASVGAGTPILFFKDTDSFANPPGPLYALAAALGDAVEGSVGPPANEIHAIFKSGPRRGDGFIGDGLIFYWSGPQGYLHSRRRMGWFLHASLLEEFTDGIVGWGRWTDGTIVTDIGYGPGESVSLFGSESQHYAIGLPTADIPTTGTASYDMIGGTSPTYAADPGAVGQLHSASLNVDFLTSKVNAAIDFSIGGTTFQVDTAPGSPGSINGANFSYSGSGTSSDGSACSGGCNTNIEGFFAGDGASRAGLAYRVQDDVMGEDINGAVGLKSNGIGSGTPIPAP